MTQRIWYAWSVSVKKECPNCGHLFTMTYDEASKGYICSQCGWPESRQGVIV